MIGKFPPHLDQRYAEGLNEMADVEPISPTFLYRLVMVSCEMHSRLSSRIYKNGVQKSASGAVSPNSQWSIPMFRAEFLPFALKIVKHSRHLLLAFDLAVLPPT